MKSKDIDRIIAECHRFLDKAALARARMMKEEGLWAKWNKEYEASRTSGAEVHSSPGCSTTKETGALRRASMDLSRELTRLRA